VSAAAAGSTVVATIALMHAKPIEALDASVLGSVALMYLVSALPFVLVGIAVAASIQHAAREMSRLYLFDLAGAAVGGLFAIAALRAGAPRAALIVALIEVAACGSFAIAATEADGPYSTGETPPSSGIITTVALGALLLLTSELASPWLKLPNLRWVQMDRVEFMKWNEMALITVDRPIGGMAWMRMDGSAATAILEPGVVPPLHPDEMAYVLHEGRGPVLVIGAGGGRDIRAALKAGQTDIDAAEINPLIVNAVMRERYAEFSGHLFERPEVHVEVADGRSYVQRSPRHYRNIVISLVDTWAAASVGALALSENSLYTVEAFRDFLEHLAPEGTLLVNRWDKEFDRLLALGAAGLRKFGSLTPADHMFGCGHSNSTSLLVKRTALAPEEVRLLRDHCRKNKFYEVFAPDAPGTARRQALVEIADPDVAVPNSPVDLSAPTDDRPFFFYSVPARMLPSVLRDAKTLKTEQMGLLTLVALACTSAFLVVALVLGPLFMRPITVLKAPDRGPRLRGLVLFASLGAGFVTVELALVQHFVMFLGHPVYALSAVLVTLLLWTGIGSLMTAKIDVTSARRAARLRALALVFVLVVYAFLLAPLLHFAVSLPFSARLGLSAVLLAPLGVLMGSQAPLGVRLLEGRAAALIPWCWGLNGVVSVVATAIATLTAMHWGFKSLLLGGALAYAVTALAVPPAAPAASRA
jgi:hypothetical protein